MTNERVWREGSEGTRVEEKQQHRRGSVKLIEPSINVSEVGRAGSAEKR